MVKGTDTIIGRHTSWPIVVVAIALTLSIFLLPQILFPRIVVRWHTEVEIDSIGFNVLRADVDSEDFRKVNHTLIPAAGNATSGGDYTYVDRSAGWGKHYVYRLQEIDANGKTTIYPQRVEVRTGGTGQFACGVVAVFALAAGVFFLRGG